jgi:hypothetical protein
MPFHFYRPSQEKYSADQVTTHSLTHSHTHSLFLLSLTYLLFTVQWLWDSGAHMITWSNKNVTNAVLDLRTMLQMQQEDGE